MKKIFSSALLLFVATTSVLAQQEGFGMEEEIKSSGKLYVVVGVVTVIFIVLFVYLFSIDRKVSKLENKN